MIDAAFRVAGTGSLGCTRIAYVVQIDDDAFRLVELKEATAPSTADSIVSAARRMVRRPPRGLAAVRLGAASFVGRRLEPQQQKLDVTAVPKAQLEATFAHIGGLVGRAHQRSAIGSWRRFSKKELAQILDHAVTLAGMHEAIYLAFCALRG
jgi:hypothetical protein